MIGVNRPLVRALGRFPISAKLKIANLEGELITLGLIVDCNPAYVMLGGIRVSNFLAESDLDFE